MRLLCQASPPPNSLLSFAPALMPWSHSLHPLSSPDSFPFLLLLPSSPPRPERVLTGGQDVVLAPPRHCSFAATPRRLDYDYTKTPRRLDYGYTKTPRRSFWVEAPVHRDSTPQLLDLSCSLTSAIWQGCLGAPRGLSSPLVSGSAELCWESQHNVFSR